MSSYVSVSCQLPVVSRPRESSSIFSPGSLARQGVFGITRQFRGQRRQIERKDRATVAAGRAIDEDRTAVSFDRALHQGEPQARTTRAAREERIENLLADLVRDARPGIPHLEP